MNNEYYVQNDTTNTNAIFQLSSNQFFAVNVEQIGQSGTEDGKLC